MDIGQVIAQNITDLLAAANEQIKNVHARAAENGVSFNYTMLTKLGSVKSTSLKNPSIETLEKAAEVLKFANGFSELQPWMLLCPGFFRTGVPRNDNQISEAFMNEVIEEFLFAVTTMKVLHLDETQYESLKNVAKFCFMKKVVDRNKDSGITAKAGAA
jgi:hypothetical protein